MPSQMMVAVLVGGFGFVWVLAWFGAAWLRRREQRAHPEAAATAINQYHRQCVIHLRADHGSREELERSLAEMLDAKPASGGMRAAWAYIEVNEKDAMDREHCPEENFGLEVIADDGVTTDRFKAELKRMLGALEAAGIGAVAACDFEDELGV